MADVDRLLHSREIPDWKNTFEFKVFPEYEYTPAQKARLNLFQTRVNHWKKTLNWVDKFDEPNKINLVYLIGYDKSIPAYVRKCKSNLVVLCAKVPKETLAQFDAYWELMDKLWALGYLVKGTDDTLDDGYYSEKQGYIDYGYGHDEGTDSILRRYGEESKIIETYKKETLPALLKSYQRYTIIDKLHPEKTIDHKDLDKIIKRYFPFGREQCHAGNPMVYKSPKLIEKAVECGLGDGTEYGGINKLLKIPDDDKYAAEILRKNVKRCIMNVNVKLRECGHVSLFEIFWSLVESPWGWGADAIAGYCFARAMKEFHADTYIADGCIYTPFDEHGQLFLWRIVCGNGEGHKLGGRYNDLTLFNEDGWHMCNRLAYMFGIESEPPLVNMMYKVRKKIEERTRYPVVILEPELHTLFASADSGFMIDHAGVTKLQKYFTYERCNEIKRKFATFNEDMWEVIQEKYPGMTQYMLQYCTTDCTGWLHNEETFWQSLERMYEDGYMYPVVYNQHIGRDDSEKTRTIFMEKWRYTQRSSIGEEPGEDFEYIGKKIPVPVFYRSDQKLLEEFREHGCDEEAFVKERPYFIVKDNLFWIDVMDNGMVFPEEVQHDLS